MAALAHVAGRRSDEPDRSVRSCKEISLCVVLFAAGLFLLLLLVTVYVEEPGPEKRFGARYLVIRYISNP